MGFTSQEIIAFILAQKEELIRHERFLREVYGSRCTQEESAADWARRYAADYRYVGTKLMDILEAEEKIDLFSEGMSEIMQHKILESQKANFEISLKFAGMYWLETHAKKWLQERKLK
jgi:hypothetical protein